MKDRNGIKIGIFSKVKIIGDDLIWDIVGEDGFGGLNIKNTVSGLTISRHPTNLEVVT